MLIGNVEIDRAEVLAEADWLAQRAGFIGSSDAAALFGAGYAFMPSVWSLWADKTGKVPRDESDDDERMVWGQLLERPILEVVKRRTGWDVLFPLEDVIKEKYDGVERWGPARLRIRAPHIRLASTCDAFVMSHEDGLGLIEVKNRDYLQWRDEYTEDDAAMRDQIQLATQMICVPAASWGVVAVLVGGNDLKLYHYKREDLATVMDDIVERADLLWTQIDDMIEPDVIDERELPAWARVHFDDPIIDQVDVEEKDRERFDEACRTIFIEDPMAKDMVKRVKAAKATITGIVGKCEVAKSPDWYLRIKTSQRQEATVTLDKPELLILHDVADHMNDDLANELSKVAAWRKVTKRAGLSRSFEVDQLHAEAEKDIVEDIRETDLGG